MEHYAYHTVWFFVFIVMTGELIIMRLFQVFFINTYI